MPAAITYAIEALVGVGCLIGAVGAWGRPHLQWLAAVLAVAGLAAVIHALIGLA